MRRGARTTAAALAALAAVMGAGPAQAVRPGEVSPAGPVCQPAPGSFLREVLVQPLGDLPQFPLCTHVDQRALFGESFQRLFDAGDALFDARYAAQDGVGANLRLDQAVTLRFSRVPRPDLPGWGARVTGPNAASCIDCHRDPEVDGSGPASVNVVRDPLRHGSPKTWLTRNTPHVFGLAGLQLVAEEMTEELHAIREAARRLAVRRRQVVTVALQAKGVAFGHLRALPGGRIVEVLSDHVDRDLVVRPLQWKGSVATVREFVRNAAHDELGLEADELVGVGVDADRDGVAGELTAGDVTVLSVYTAAQPPPRRLLHLIDEGFLDASVPDRQRAAIVQGEKHFERIGCTGCHVPTLKLSRPVYAEPSRNPFYRDRVFAGGVLPEALGLDAARPVRFDLRRDVDPPYPCDPVTGEVLVELFSDLRRHDMGPGLAEPVDELGNGAARFLTRPLWGVGETAPYLHDGRATTLSEAILWHGGDAQGSRDAFAALSADEQAEVVEFLKSLVVFKPR